MSFKKREKKKSRVPWPTLDLHGYRTDEVFDALDTFLIKASKQGQSKVRVMTGKGKGLVASEAKRYLQSANYPFHFEKLENGKTNDGVLVVILD